MSGSSQLLAADPAPTRTRESIALHRTWVRKAWEHKNSVRPSPEGRGAAEVETDPTASGGPGPGATCAAGLCPAEESQVLQKTSTTGLFLCHLRMPRLPAAIAAALGAALLTQRQCGLSEVESSHLTH